MHRIFPALAVGFFGGLVVSCTGTLATCIECGGRCVDLNVDSSNCGACGNQCPGGSVCADAGCVLRCQERQSACEGACFDLSIDPRHCGACGNACPGGCVDGGCVSSGRCGALSECGGRCVDPSVDPSNCGGCGVSCDGGICRNATCALCSGPGLLECGGRCADTAVDPSNCGGCGVSCDGGVCRNSACAPACSGGGLRECGNRCVDTSVDPSNCGGCGVSCDGGFCLNNACVLCVGAGLLECGGRCVDTQVDPSNCGGCGTSCDGGYCVGSSCRSLCGAGTAPCNGRCVVTDTDVRNCGGCGVVCGGGPNATPTCSMGSCSLTCDPGRFDCDGVAANGCESYAGCVVPISLRANGTLANDFQVPSTSVGALNSFSLSADGQRVAFVTASDGIVATDVNGRSDYFVRNLTTGVTVGLTHGLTGGAPFLPEIVISANGEVVAFTSPLDLTGQGADGGAFVYAWMPSTGRFTRLVDSNTHDERDLDLSDDGQRLAFVSSATNLGVSGQRYRGWVLTLDAGFTMVFDPSPSQSWPADAGCPYVGSSQMKLSGDGQLVAISTNARLTADDTNTAYDTFVRPLDGGPIELVSRQSDGGPSTTQRCSSSGSAPDLNGDGSLAVFYGDQPLASGSTALFNIWARRGATTFLVSTGVTQAFFPSVDRAGLRFSYQETTFRCVYAEVSGTQVTQTPLAFACDRSRIAAGGHAVAFLSKDTLVPDAGANGGVNLYLKFLP